MTQRWMRWLLIATVVLGVSGMHTGLMTMSMTGTGPALAMPAMAEVTVSSPAQATTGPSGRSPGQDEHGTDHLCLSTWPPQPGPEMLLVLLLVVAVIAGCTGRRPAGLVVLPRMRRWSWPPPAPDLRELSVMRV